jgi:NAD(P)-dependent dehydrogenase (short-subunit alcohol dehydrogenase family)
MFVARMISEAAHALSTHSDGLPTPPANIIVIGGSSGMGKAAAIACVKRGGKALIVSRSEDKLAKAAEEIRSHAPSKTSSNRDESDLVVETAVLDATDEDAVKTFVEETLTPSNESPSDWDGLVVSAAGRAPHGPLATLPTASTRELFESKFWSAYHCAKHIGPKLRTRSAIVFVAGVLNRRPGMNCAPLASTNGALEGLTRALALEWGPDLRVNCLRYVWFGVSSLYHILSLSSDARNKIPYAIFDSR